MLWVWSLPPPVRTLRVGLIQALHAMSTDTAKLLDAFGALPATPAMSLRGGNAADDYAIVPSFDARLDQLTSQYLETYFWGIHHLDAESWRFYLPHFLRYALDNIANPASQAIDAVVYSLRPPDRDPPRFGSLTHAQIEAVTGTLNQLAFSGQSAWKEPAMIALEEYWAPGARYR